MANNPTFRPKIIDKPLNEIKPYKKNNKLHPDEQVEKIATQIRKFGFDQPIVIDEKGVILKGHGRLLAAQKLKLKKVPTITHAGLKAPEKRALRIGDNRVAKSDWNLPSLRFELGYLDSLNIDLPESTGFDPDEIEDLLVPEKHYEDKDADAVPETPKKAKSKRGQIYKLGEHRLMCGDATKDIDDLLQGSKVHFGFTDPPYGIGFKYESYDDTEENWYKFINTILPILRDNSEFVVMPSCSMRRIGWWYENHNPKWLMCWYKGSPGHRSDIGFNDWESHLCWGKPQKQMHDFWQTECGFDKKLNHPCPKPVAYAEWLIDKSGSKTILDVCGGSGTALIASEKLNRKCYMMEIEPKYVDVIIKRWEDFTGKKAELIDG